MKNYRYSDYAANKFASGIVYRFADETVEITLDDYLRENPSMTESDFLDIKSISDALFLEQARDDVALGRKAVAAQRLEGALHTGSVSPEELVFDVPERIKASVHKQHLARQALGNLTETQLRRYYLYHAKGLTFRQIAKIEGVTHSKIQKSVAAAEKRINKFLAQGKNGGTKRPQKDIK